MLNSGDTALLTLLFMPCAMSQSMALTNWHGPVWANYQNKINSNFYCAIRLTVSYHLIYSCSLSDKNIQLLDSLKLLNSFLHSSTLALAPLGAAVWWQQGSLTSGDSAGGAVTSGQEVETWFWKQRQDGPRPATQELRASLSRYRTVLEHHRYWQSMPGEMSAACPSGMMQVQEDCGHISPATDNLHGFGGTGQSLRASVYPCGHGRQCRPWLELIHGQGVSQSQCRWGLWGAGGVRGPKANAGLPLWLQTLEQGKDRKMPNGLQSRSVLRVCTRTIRIVYFKTRSGPACAIWHTGPVGNSEPPPHRQFIY